MSYTEEERIKAKRRALYILAQRDHSAKELYDKLIKNYPPELCELTVEIMKDFGYLDEEKYSKKLYRYYMNKGWGKSRIRFELKRRGLSEGLIALCEEEYDNEDYIEEIISLINKKYINKLDFSDYGSVQRVTAALARRGFSYDDIKTAMRRVREECDDENDDYEFYE
ncbi:MAG: regulatory protein RecX [Ruminiclostridium sp.]|nr:regulatory protein RecX [Ruminiclostridium sp.]